MRASYFYSRYDNLPKPKEFKDFKELYDQHYSSFEERGEKDGKAFSYYLYAPRMKRSRENVVAISAIVLDFDNTNGVTSYEDLCVELDDYCHIYHTTYSASDDCNKYRIIIPLDRELVKDNAIYFEAKWSEMFTNLVDLLGNPPGLDTTSSELGRVFYLPACPVESTYSHRSLFHDGQYFKIDQEERAFSKIRTSTHSEVVGRNNILKAQVAKCFHLGKGADETAREILEYDTKHHNPSLFEGGNEDFRDNTPRANALLFVSRVWKSISKMSGKDANISNSNISIISDETAVDIAEKESNEIDNSIIDKTPGVAGEIVDWILTTAIKQARPLALASTLALLGTLKGQKFATPTNLRTNHYILGVAPSGSGKGHPRICIENLLTTLDQSALRLGKPQSDSGLINALATTNGVGLLTWDEIGFAIAGMGDRSTPSFERRLLPLLLEIWSQSSSTFVGKEYADRKVERVDLEQPCLNLFGTTTNEVLSRSISTHNISDGFLPRFLVFFLDSKTTLNLDGGYVPFRGPALQKLLALSAINPRDRLGNVAPIVVSWENENVKKLSQDIWINYEEKIESSCEHGRSLWSRANEHMLKIALTVEESESVITQESLLWAKDLVDNLISKLYNSIFNNVSDTYFQREVQRVYAKILENPRITQKELGQWVKNRYKISQLNEFLNHLTETAQVGVVEEKTRGRVKKCYVALSSSSA